MRAEVLRAQSRCCGDGGDFHSSLLSLAGEVVNTHGPVEPDKDNIRQEPYTLPQGFTWDALDLGDRGVVSRGSSVCESPSHGSVL